MAVVFALGLILAIWVGSQAERIRAMSVAVQTVPHMAEDAPPAIPPPPVEPLVLKDVTPQDAVAINAAVAFSTAPNPAARPFRFTGDPAARARALDCLAAAMLYEAGTGDETGQRAVAQVVLNRVRHPAFPKTVCGVVFQGQERATGCQFTFTCDGALVRVLSEDAWTRARKTAGAALDGRVFAPVGYATHYHTNWVVPYWSASLDKVTAVGTHLFFRWAGWWGTPGAFRGAVSGSEPAVPKLAAFSEAHRAGLPEGMADGTPAAGALAVPASKPRSLMQTGDTFVVTLDRKALADSYTSLALATCGARPYCKFMGWIDPEDTPRALPMDPLAADRMAFSYLRMKDSGFEKSLWNCAKFPRAANQCIRGTAGTASKGNAALRRRPGVATATPAVEASAVRRRPEAPALPEPGPSQ